jgi:hypothetical protein
MAMWILGAVFALVGLPFVWIARRAFARDRAEARWPRAPGLVISARLDRWTETSRDQDGYYRDYTWYKPVVRYTYTVGGQVLEGKRIARAIDDVNTDRKTAQRYVDRYPVEKPIMVLYDPGDPAKALLEVRRSIGAVILLVFGCVWIAIGALLIALSLLV